MALFWTYSRTLAYLIPSSPRAQGTEGIAHHVYRETLEKEILLASAAFYDSVRQWSSIQPGRARLGRFGFFDAWFCSAHAISEFVHQTYSLAPQFCFLAFSCCLIFNSKNKLQRECWRTFFNNPEKVLRKQQCSGISRRLSQANGPNVSKRVDK